MNVAINPKKQLFSSDENVIIIPVFSPTDFLKSPLQEWAGIDVEKKCTELSFTGAWGTAEIFLAPENIKREKHVSFVAVIGLGSFQLPTTKQGEGFRRGLGKVMQDVRRHMVKEATLVLNHLSHAGELSAAALEAAHLSNYRFAVHNKKIAEEKKKRSLVSLNLLVQEGDKKEIQKVASRIERIMAGVELTRNLVNQPASHASPAHLVAAAKAIVKGSNQISLKVLDKKAATRAHFNAFLAVAQGSAEEPYVIHLIYKPKKKTKKKVALVGKGITFDSGGLSLKPANYMMDMKIDMAGAATVLGVFSLLPSLDVDVEVHGIIATCENMPSGNAFRPGDIVTAKNGKTIEVLNTDAEGRLTLADALAYALEQKPDAVVDLATLTGACVIAVGETHAGLWSNADSFRDELLQAGEKAGEGLVAFPLPEEYKPAIVSKIADLRNIGTTRYGDAILAALFLQEFVGETPWAHIDLAGPVYNESSSLLSYLSYGATGYGVRTLVHYLENLK